MLSLVLNSLFCISCQHTAKNELSWGHILSSCTTSFHSCTAESVQHLVAAMQIKLSILCCVLFDVLIIMMMQLPVLYTGNKPVQSEVQSFLQLLPNISLCMVYWSFFGIQAATLFCFKICTRSYNSCYWGNFCNFFLTSIEL